MAGTDAKDGEVWQSYEGYFRAAPEIVFEWNDRETAARGWLVINSLKGGAAGGGTRMRVGLTRDEVTFLAKAMELKFAFAGPPIGGAKSWIDFDPADPRKKEVLTRWFQAIQSELLGRYGTAGDLNVCATLDFFTTTTGGVLVDVLETGCPCHFRTRYNRQFAPGWA